MNKWWFGKPIAGKLVRLELERLRVVERLQDLPLKYHSGRFDMKVRSLRLVVSVAGVALVTFMAFSVIPVNATTAGFAYLLYVLIIASVCGFLEACISSVAATLVFNFL
jgi:K+-sensing histidine kinase KdpD